MSQEPGPIEADKPKESVPKEISTIAFPYDDLDAGVEVARAVLDYGGRCTNDQLVATFKYSSVDNGAFRMRLGTARHFGLITVSRDAINITPLGRQILDPTTAAGAKAAAFLTVPLYKRAYDEHKGFTLPPTAAGLEQKFVEYGVSSKQKDKARQVFQRSADQAQFFAHGKDRLVAPAVVALREPPPSDGHEEMPNVDDRLSQKAASQATTPAVGGARGDKPLHPFIRGLVDALPEPNKPWSDAERDEWLTAAKSIFALIYKPNRIALPPAGGTTQT